MNRRFLAAAPVAALTAAAVVACGPSGGSGASVPSVFTPNPSYSQQASAAASAASQVLTRCQPKGDSATQWEVALVFHPKATVSALEDCENIPPAQRQAFTVCIVDAAKAAHSGSGDKASKETGFIGGASKCVQAAQGATPAPSASHS